MEIKICPFCGWKPDTFPKKPEVEGNAWGEVKCINLKCPAKPSVLDGVNVADDRGIQAYINAAIKRWNKRHYVQTDLEELNHAQRI